MRGRLIELNSRLIFPEAGGTSGRFSFFALVLALELGVRASERGTDDLEDVACSGTEGTEPEPGRKKEKVRGMGIEPRLST